MKVSISFATIRYGWIENTFKSLGRQVGLDKKDWELIMVDDILEDRSDYILGLAEREGINCKWMRSKANHWKSNRMLGNARNTGFIHSDGELIVFLDDYTWVGKDFLAWHWKKYKESGDKAIIGRVNAVKYKDIVNDYSELEIMNDDHRCKTFMDPNKYYGWFWTFNTSAPLSKIIEVNGYDEEFDCTGEDDIDLGERLNRIRLGFTYIADIEITAFHMQHGGGMSKMACPCCNTDLSMFDNCMNPVINCSGCGKEINVSSAIRSINIQPRYKEDEIHKVTKWLYGTQYDGSWGLLERNSKRNPWDVNRDGGNCYFDLKIARENRDKYPFKEYKVK